MVDAMSKPSISVIGHAPRFLAFLLTVFGATTGVADETAAWQFDQVPTAVFADADQTWRIGVGSVPAGSSLAWSIAMNERVLARGEAELISTEDRAKPEVVRLASLRWRTPPLKPGVVMPVRCSLSVQVDRRQLTETSFDAWVFPADPFALRRDWLKSLDLQLLTTEPAVVRLFDTAQIPFRRVPGPSAIERLPRGVLVVSGVESPEQRRSIGVAIEAFVRRGGRCLWIAPPANTTVLNATAASDVGWRRWDVRREDLVNDFDKRLDRRCWNLADARVVPIHLETRRGDGGSTQTIWRASEQSNGWPWLRATTDTGGQLIACGFPLLSTWEQAPTPRYLFAHILESFVPADTAP